MEEDETRRQKYASPSCDDHQDLMMSSLRKIPDVYYTFDSVSNRLNMNKMKTKLWRVCNGVKDFVGSFIKIYRSLIYNNSVVTSLRRKLTHDHKGMIQINKQTSAYLNIIVRVLTVQLQIPPLLRRQSLEAVSKTNIAIDLAQRFLVEVHDFDKNLPRGSETATSIQTLPE
jgi:hypothetical protein